MRGRRFIVLAILFGIGSVATLLVALGPDTLADTAAEGEHIHSEPCGSPGSTYHHHSFGCHSHQNRPNPTPRPTRRPNRPTYRPTPRPPATPVAPPRALAVEFSGEAFTDNHLLLTQGGGPTLDIDLVIRPGNQQVPNTHGGVTTVWPPVAGITVRATLIDEIHCADVAGIQGGCATLPRRGHSLNLANISPATPGNPCAEPADIDASLDAAGDLLVVNADGSGGGPGVWEIEVEVATAEVPAGSCTPPTAQAAAAATGDQIAPDNTIVALRLADMVAK